MFDIRTRHLILPLVLGIVILLIGTAHQLMEPYLRYDRDSILQGEIWRIVSAHFLHLSWGHLWMNLAGLALVFGFFGSLLTTREWLFVIALCAVAISVTLIFSAPDLRWYVGLSGVLHGLFVAGGIRDFKVRRIESILFLGFISLKLLWEQLMGPLPGSEQAAGGPVLVDAHLYGALFGLLAIVTLNLLGSKTTIISR